MMGHNARRVIALIVLLGTLLSLSGVVYAADELNVTNVNIVLADDISTTVYLNYQTDRTSSYRDPQPDTIVYYYEAGEEFDQNINASVEASARANNRIGYHRATIKGLTPDTKYFYRVVDRNTDSVSKEYSFTTKGETDDFTFIATADADYRNYFSYQNHYGNTLAAAVEQFPQAAFITHTGQANTLFASQAYWDGFFDQGGDVFANYPLVPSTVSVSLLNRMFQLNFNLPYNGTYNTDNYSFVYGDALFIQLNTQMTITSNVNKQIKWLRSEVEEKGEGKWIIVSIGNSFFGRGYNISAIKRKLEPVFNELGVSMVIQGTDDSYVRSYPISSGSILSDYPSTSTISKKDGTIYLSPGASGTEQRNGDTGRDWICVASDFSDSSERLLAENKMYTAIRVTAEAIEVSAYTVGGTLVDQFEINNQDTPEPMPAA